MHQRLRESLHRRRPRTKQFQRSHFRLAVSDPCRSYMEDANEKKPT